MNENFKKELEKIECDVKELEHNLALSKIGFAVAKALYLVNYEQKVKSEQEINALEMTLIVKKMTLSFLTIFQDYYNKIEKKGDNK